MHPYVKSNRFTHYLSQHFLNTQKLFTEHPKLITVVHGGTPTRTKLLPHLPNKVLTYLHNALDIAMSLSKVNSSQLCWTFPVLHMGPEHRPSSFSLASDYTAHGVLGGKIQKFKSQ